MIFFVLLGEMVFFSRKYDLILQTKNERWSFSKNTWKYDIFCIFAKDGISISCKYDITLLSKTRRWSSPEKNTFKDDIPDIIEKDDIHSRKYGISCDRKIKDDKRFTFIKRSSDSMYF